MRNVRFLIVLFFILSINSRLFVLSAHEIDSLANTLMNPQDNPIAFFTTVDEACSGDTVYFTNGSSGDFTSIYWDFGDGIDAGAWENPFHIYDTAGVYKIVMKVTLDRGGQAPVIDTFSTEINILPSPILEIHHSDTLIYEGSTAVLTAIGDFTSVLWENGSTSTELEVGSPGFYTVTVSDDIGCTSTATSEEIVVIPDEGEGIVVLNNILTPNGDGINDILIVKDKALYINPIAIEIYNVWGGKVFSSSDYRQESWTATDVDAGTFYYIISSEGKKSTTGFVDVIK